MTRFALDYDGTHNANPDLWDTFITQAQQTGNTVVIVTMRFTNEDISEFIPEGVPIIYCGRMAKKRYVENLNLEFDVWIDDQPHFLFQDAWQEISNEKGKAVNHWNDQKFFPYRTLRHDLSKNLLDILSA